MSAFDPKRTSIPVSRVVCPSLYVTRRDLPKVLLFWRDPCGWGGTCSGASSSQYSVARRWHGRFRCMRSRARGSGASAYSWVTLRAIQKRNCVSRHFVPASQNAEGRKATTSRTIIGFPPPQTVSKPLAKELLALHPEVVLAHTTTVVAAVQRESQETPVVFVGVSDPIGSGFVTSLARPNANLTGVMQYEQGIVS